MLALQALTFELRIMARKKRMLLYQHKSGFKRIITFKMNAQEAKPGQPLAPLLGQVQINVGEFINYFNNKTKDYPKGLSLYVKLFVKWDKTYHIEIKKLSLIRLLNLFIYTDVILDYTQDQDDDLNTFFHKKRISLLNFMKVVNIFSTTHHISLDRSCEVVFNQIHLLSVDIDELDVEDYETALETLRSYISFKKLGREIFELK